MGLEHLTLFLKQGDFGFFNSQHFSIPAAIAGLIECDGLPRLEPVLVFLNWFTRSLGFAHMTLANSALWRFLAQQAGQSDRPALVYRIYANFIAADGCFLADFAASAQMIQTVDRFIPTIETRVKRGNREGGLRCNSFNFCV
jgi:hypothetical protein